MSGHTNKEYSFTERWKWMEEARQLLDRNFYPHITYNGQWVYLGASVGSTHFQRECHIDTAGKFNLGVLDSIHVNSVALIRLHSGVQSLTIDEKLDSKARSTFFLETMSAAETERPGWMVPGVSKADVLLWAFNRKRPAGLGIYMVWMDKLIDWFWPRKDAGEFREYHVRNRENGRKWTTVGYQVPVSQIPYYLFIVRNYVVEAQLSLPGFTK